MERRKSQRRIIFENLSNSADVNFCFEINNLNRFLKFKSKQMAYNTQASRTDEINFITDKRMTVRWDIMNSIALSQIF